MNKKELNKIISAGLTASMVLTPLSNSFKVVNAQTIENIYDDIMKDIQDIEDNHYEDTNNDIQNIEDYSNNTVNEVKNTKTVDLSQKQIFLSELEHDTDKSQVYNNNLLKNRSSSGDNIHLIVDGEVVIFDNGIGAHAPSTVVYNISEYKDVYTKFISYMGVDNRKSGTGDGVKFSIYTSEDGTEWDLAEDVGLLTPDEESGYVEIELNGANYIKLYAHQNGGNGYDHSAFADARLVKSDYSSSIAQIPNLHKLEHYDNILKAHDAEYNLQHNEMTILRRAFVQRVGYKTIERLLSQQDKYVEGLSYLLNDENALKYFITGGPVNIGGSYVESVKYFCDIYSAYKEELKDTSDNNFHLRLAISISLAYARKDLVRFWLESNKEISAVKRYEVYKELISSERMDNGGNQNSYGKWTSEQFKALPVTLMRWAVSNRINDDEILWLADHALKEKDKNKDYLNAYNYITYRKGYDYANDKYYDQANYNTFNDKYNFGSYYDDYGTKGVYRLWTVFEEGSVCGGLAKTYSNLATTFGRPSSVVSQPGHAATITYAWNSTNQRYEWILQNDISGWVQSGNEYSDRMLNWGNQSWSKSYSASYAILATDAVNDYNNYIKATLLNLLANSYTDNNAKKDTYLKALSYQKINLDSMEGLIKCYKNDDSKTSSDYLELAKTIIDTYTYYPQAMMELLSLIESNITDSSDTAQLDILKYNALTSASKATPSVSTNVTASKQLANHYLQNESTELASFSFDGEHAGKIVINSKYSGSEIRVKYSLDGGKTWLQSNEHIISLTKDQLDSITAENDIKVGLVGVNDFYTIDILAGKQITSSSIYANDLENLLIGSTDNLEFSTDGGLTWCNYIAGLEQGIRFEGDKTVKVRYKAYEQYLQSNEFEYRFTEDTDIATRKYIQLKNITLEDFTSQQSNTINHAGVNLIDGTPNTAWHTTFNVYATDKFYTVSLDKVRHITSLEYLPGGNNGRLKNGEIYTSLDGKTWTLSGSFENLKHDTTLKTIDLDEPTACKYIKIVATSTYGNSTNEQDMYFSGKMLNFYEDSTKEYIAKPTIEYSNTSPTNQNVTATIKLSEGCEVIGDNTHTFTDNDTYTFRYTDANKVEHSIDAKVTWIDREAPTANIIYDIDAWTNENVTATLTDASENITILNDEDNVIKTIDGVNSYVFKNNGSHTFRFKDEAGNIGTATATVSWIDKTKPDKVTEFKNNIQDNKNIVVASLNINLDEVEVLNNGGKAEYTFTKNETFVFKLRLKDTGYEFEIPVTVDWLNDSVVVPDDETTQKPDNNSNSNSNNSNGNNNGNTQKPVNENSSNNENSGDDNKPQTGDSMLSSITLFGISLAGILGLNRRKNEEYK